MALLIFPSVLWDGQRGPDTNECQSLLWRSEDVMQCGSMKSHLNCGGLIRRLVSGSAAHKDFLKMLFAHSVSNEVSGY